MDKLSDILWRERELLDSLLFKLEVEQMVLATGRTHWLGRAAREVELVLTVLRETEILRSVAADEAAETVGLSPNPSLRALAEAAPEPWRGILLDHRQGFEEVSRQITALAENNRELLTVGLRSAREALLDLEQSAEGYRPDGGAVLTELTPRLVDRSL
ncbi:flagellar protein FlgN [Nocardioides mangrovicus]|uniref:Flagellar protein FlgN n=1 Tax=Nocardioides mangrovicus TaxID=2478913 RepID=A0A3L8P1U6_9ACTN|nr:flagellar export chaperone FlgN [Nocardioides mangrovicus]RLV48793.1 flagellar protein FlgN [Nocardioides mangrovicus]